MKQIKGRTDFDKLVTCTSLKKIIYILKKNLLSEWKCFECDIRILSINPGN